MENGTFPTTFYTFKDEGLVVEVVDVIKMYPSILNNSNWRDANYQMVKACDQFHPYVFSKYTWCAEIIQPPMASYRLHYQ